MSSNETLMATLMGPDSHSNFPRPAGVLNRETLVVIMRILSLVREESRLAKRVRSLWREREKCFARNGSRGAG